MINWEPSDRKDRRIQREKLRGMWESLRNEKARLAMFDWCGRPHYGVDNTLVDRELDENGKAFWRGAGPVIAAFAALGVILCLMC